jgi:hypothetical protein
LPCGYEIHGMQTVFETRRARLGLLVRRYGSVANINRALGWEVTNARLYQVHNSSVRSDRGTPYEMGDATARELEDKIGLGKGWMDTPPTYDELDPDPQVAKLIEIARMLRADDRGTELAQLVAIGHTFVEPPAAKANSPQ